MKQITTMKQLSELDEEEVVEGYLDGLKGEPKPGNNRSLSYKHGWNNGAVDAGYQEKTPTQAVLAHDYIKYHNIMS